MKNKHTESLRGKESKKDKSKSTPLVIDLLRWSFRLLGPLFPKLAAQKAMNLFMTPKRRKGSSFSGIFNKAYVMGTPYKGTRITSYMWGESGKIVLLVHGWESSSRIYESFVVPLLTAGYRVVAIDGPAHGDSKLKQTNLFDFGDALHAVLKRFEAIGEVYALVGHSFGGSSLVNMLYRKGKPGSLQKIAIIASPSRLDRVFYYFFRYMHLPKTVIHNFKTLLHQKFGVSMEALNVANWASELGMDNILVIHDVHDKVIRCEEAEVLVASGGNFTPLFTEGLGHNRIMKDPDVIKNVVAYLYKKPALIADVSREHQKVWN